MGCIEVDNMRFLRRTDKYDNMVDWIENGDPEGEIYFLDVEDRLVQVINGFLEYTQKKPSITIDFNPSRHKILFDDLKEHDTTFEVYWTIGGGFRFAEVIDASLDDESWNTTTDPLAHIKIGDLPE